MSTDELALRFRQWADAQLAFLERMSEAHPTMADQLRRERAGIRSSVVWVESVAGVPESERLVYGGTRRQLASVDPAELVRLAEARKVAAESGEVVPA